MESNFINGEYGLRLLEIVGKQQFDSVLGSFSCDKRTSFRVNTIHGSVADTLESMRDLGIEISTVDWCEEAFSVETKDRRSLTHSPQAESGLIYVQGLSSIFATTILSPEAGQWNLDLASAPGGKATHMAAMMKNEGKLSVVEPIKPRMYRLAANLKRMGVTISKTYLMDGRKVGKKVPERFDRVMLDAPCSSDSRIRADNPESWQFWSPRKVKEQSRKQRGLIVSGFESLKPGGTMLYCTCSFSPEENEAIVSHLIESTDGEAKLQPIEMPFGHWQPGMTSFRDARYEESVSLTRRILPNEHHDAFFIAKITK